MLGAIEAGGTKFVCAIGNEQGTIIERIQIPTTEPKETIIERIQIPTTEPKETMQKVCEFFEQHPVEAIGVGSFGPIDVNKESLTYGFITSTPKQGWRDFPFVSFLENVFSVPIGFHTDVNAAALGEITLGAAKGLDSCLYITVGTGIGAGAIVQGKLLQGLSHPEMGHILVRRQPDDYYQGKCPFHHDCLEGLASGPAIEDRWGKKGIDLKDCPQVWDLEGFYLAQALMQYILILSPKKIILGGGVMNQKEVFSAIYTYLPEMVNHYIPLPKISKYIVSPGLGADAGITGALLLARQAIHER